MADALIDIAMKFKIADLKSAMDDFKQVTEGATISPKIKADRALIMEQFKIIIEQAQKQMAAGTLDPASLGLPKLIANVETIYRNLATKAGIILSEEFKKLTDKALQTSTEIDDLTSKLKAMEDEKKNLTSTKIIAQAKGDTGFTGAAVGGSNLDEAAKQLEKLNKIEETGAKVPGLKKKILFYTRLVALFKQAQEKFTKYGNDSKKMTTRLNKLKKDQVEIQEKLAIETQKNANIESPQMQKLVGVVAKLTSVKASALDVTKSLTNETKKQNKASREAADGNGHEAKSLTQKATAAFSYFLVFNQLKRVFNDTLRTIKQLDKAMTDAAIVTSMNRKEAWQLLDSYQQLAKRTGLATSEIATTVTQFLRQGRTIKDAMQLTEVAAKSAKVAGISASEAVNYLTSAVNGFNLAANQSEEIADKFASIAARSATSFEELALAMSKVAPTAKSAGVSVDFMMGVIAKGIETTREAPENIGTAFKTIFARMREVTDLGKAMEDGMDLNRVEKALLSVGVPLRDVTGQFRNLETVLIEVGEKWETLTSVEQAYLATALAGSRQQPRLLAIFNDFARTKELIQISADATGELANQHIQYMKGSEAAFAQLKTAWQQLTMSFMDIEIVIGLIRTATSIIESFAATVQGTANGTQMFTTILIGLAAAYTILTSKKLLNIVYTLALNIATLTGTTLTTALGASVSITAAEYAKLTFFQKLFTLSSIKAIFSKKMLTLALGKLAIGLKKTISLFLGLLKALLPFIAIGAIVYVIISEIGRYFEEAGRKASYFAEKVQETNSEIAKLGARSREIKTLADRFDELSKKLNKSVAEIEEMNSLAKELESIEMDGEKFNLTRQDITGKIVIDQAEYDRFNNFVTNKREILLKQNLATFRASLARDFEGTLNDRSLMKIFENIGFDFGKQFIEGMKDGMSSMDVDVEEEATDFLGNLSKMLKPESFAEDAPLFRFKADWTYAQDVRDLVEDQTFATQEDAMKWLEEQRRTGKISDWQFQRLSGQGPANNLGTAGGFVAGAGAGALVGGKAGAALGALAGGVGAGPGLLIGALAGAIIGGTAALFTQETGIGTGTALRPNQLEQFEGTSINQEKIKKSIQELIKTYSTGIAVLKSETERILADENLTPLQKTAQIFSANAEEYNKIVQAIEDNEFLSDDQKEVAIKAVGATLPDAVILDELINKKEIPVTVLAKMAVDLSIEDLFDVINDMDKELAKKRTVEITSCGVNVSIEVDALTPQQEQAYRQQFAGILGDLFSNDADGVTAGFAGLKTYVDSLVAAGVMNAEAGQKYIIALSNKIKTLSLEDAAGLLKDQMELSKELFDLSNKLGQGDFSNFAKLVETVGLDRVKALLSKDTKALETYFEEQNAKAIDQIEESIAKIRGIALTEGRLGDTLTDQEKQQIEAFEIMINYYDKLAIQEQLRNFRLGEATNLLKKMNDVLSLQDKLSNLGFSGGIFDIFRDMADNYYKDGLGFLTKQVEVDFANLEKFRTPGGLFNPDDLGLGQAAIDQAMGSLTTLVDAVTDAYNRQKKTIEDRYKTEVDAIKSSHSERWSTIDYTNKLAEAENRILASRRLLMGLALSGVSKGVMDQTEADLKKLQQARQKIIEDQAVKKAEDQMKIEMDKELLKVQTDLTTGLNTLGISLQTYSNVLLQNTDPQRVLKTVLKANSDNTILNTATIADANATTANLIESNGHLISAMNHLALVMRPGSVTNSANDTITIASPKANVDRGFLSEFDGPRLAG